MSRHGKRRELRLLQEFPTLSERAAGEQASDAICYASLYYPQWLWSGLGQGAELVRRTPGQGHMQDLHH